MTLLKDADLLKSNKQELVEALNHFGFSEVTMETPLDKFSKYIKSLGGIPYYEIAAVSRDGKLHLIDCEEWDNPSMFSVSKKGGYVVVGLSVKAEGRKVLISKSYGNRTPIVFSADYEVEGVEYVPSNGKSVWNTFDGASDCDKILSQLDGTTGVNGVQGCPAVKTAMQYTVTGASADAVKWYLPSIGELLFIKKYLYDFLAKDKSLIFGIQTMLAKYSMEPFLKNGHFSCTPARKGLVLSSYLGYASIASVGIEGTMLVRSVGVSMEEYKRMKV